MSIVTVDKWRRWILIVLIGLTYLIGPISRIPVAHASAVSGNSPVTSLQNGLVGYWTFDGQHTNWANGKTYDQSGKGNHGTLTSMSTSTTPTAGKFGQALKFDGSNDDVNIPAASSINDLGPMTISAWVNWRSGGQFGLGHVMGKGVGGGTGSFALRVGTTNRYEFVVDYDGATDLQKYAGNNAIVYNEWHHVAVTWDGTANSSGITIYKNGVVLASVSTTEGAGSRISDSANNLVIGDRSTAGGRAFDGLIDEVRVYNRAFSSAEIKRLYSLGTAKFANSPVTSLQNSLVGYWTLDGQHTNWANGKTYDQSGKGNHGTLTNMSTSTTPTAGKLGQALDFDGVNNYVNVGSIEALQMSGNITMAAWIKARTFATNEGILGMIGAGEASSLNALYLLYFDASSGNDIGYLHETASGEDSSNVFDTNLSANTWYHVAATRDVSANTVKLYVNGVQSGSTYSYTNDPNGGGSSALHIGRRNSAAPPANEMDGLIDDVRVYNRALSVAEIKRLYSLGAAKFSNSPVTSLQNGLAGYWTFDGQHTNWANGKTYDQSGKGNHGTLTSMSTSTAPVAGKLGQGLKFDGSNDAIDVGSPSSFAVSQVTVSAWAKDTRASWATSDYQNVFVRGVSQSSAASESYGLVMRANAANSQFWEMRVSDGTTNHTAASATGLSNSGKWTHLVGTYDSSGVTRLYINGKLIDTETGGGAINNPANVQTGIGAQTAGTDARFWTGLIDEVRVYNRALSAAEIQRLYQLGR